jgi:hypothetical protein
MFGEFFGLLIVDSGKDKYFQSLSFVSFKQNAFL